MSAPPLQSRFLAFHERIKLDNADELAILRDKRDAILRRMRDRSLTFDAFNQGSYAMGTGVLPVEGDFDIDVGIVLTGPERPKDPLDAKTRVYDAVRGHTPNVEWRRHCIRVQYVKAGQPSVHVDLPVYWKSQDWWGASTYHLAVGKQHSSLEHRSWELSEPLRFIEKVKEFLDGEQRQQFRRVVRYLKRWKDVCFRSEGNAAPVGIGLTVVALEFFQPRYVGFLPPTSAAQFDDLDATRRVVDGMRARFYPRLVAKLPVEPRRDVFHRMTDPQMREFRTRLDALSLQLAEARQRHDPAPLQQAFGRDF